MSYESDYRKYIGCVRSDYADQLCVTMALINMLISERTTELMSTLSDQKSTMLFLKNDIPFVNKPDYGIMIPQLEAVNHELDVLNQARAHMQTLLDNIQETFEIHCEVMFSEFGTQIQDSWDRTIGKVEDEQYGKKDIVEAGQETEHDSK